jgi:hypothetical protein
VSPTRLVQVPKLFPGSATSGTDRHKHGETGFAVITGGMDGVDVLAAGAACRKGDGHAWDRPIRATDSDLGGFLDKLQEALGACHDYGLTG